MNDEELKQLLERVNNIETALAERDTRIKTLEEENKVLTTKLASLKVDNLATKVETSTTPVVEEDITFDFDLI